MEGDDSDGGGGGGRRRPANEEADGSGPGQALGLGVKGVGWLYRREQKRSGQLDFYLTARNVTDLVQKKHWVKEQTDPFFYYQKTKKELWTTHIQSIDLCISSVVRAKSTKSFEDVNCLYIANLKDSCYLKISLRAEKKILWDGAWNPTSLRPLRFCQLALISKQSILFLSPSPPLNSFLCQQ